MILLGVIMLFLEYATKQAVEGMPYIQRDAWTYRAYRFAHLALLSLTLLVVYQPGWPLLVILLGALLIGSSEWPLVHLQRLLHERTGAGWRFLHLLPAVGLVTLAALVSTYFNLEYSPLVATGAKALASSALPVHVPISPAALAIAGYLFLAQPTNHIIRCLVGKEDDAFFIDAVVQREVDAKVPAFTTAMEETATATDEATVPQAELRAGRIIGILERWLLLTLMFLSQYSLIGLVLTAKSVARYSKIDKEPAFAEYYLVGTLYSTLAALVVGLSIILWGVGTFVSGV